MHNGLIFILFQTGRGLINEGKIDHKRNKNKNNHLLCHTSSVSVEQWYHQRKLPTSGGPNIR